MLWRTRRFLKYFISATWHCVCEELAMLPIAIVITIFVGLLWLACDMVLEGGEADVPSLVSAVSINPNA